MYTKEEEEEEERERENFEKGEISKLERNCESCLFTKKAGNIHGLSKNLFLHTLVVAFFFINDT